MILLGSEVVPDVSVGIDDIDDDVSVGIDDDVNVGIDDIGYLLFYFKNNY